MWLSSAFVIATAPGKLILTGEYAVLNGAPALVIAVDRRAIARRDAVRGSSPFLLAVAQEIAKRHGETSVAARAALEIAVDSSAFYDSHGTKLGLGSSAAVTVAATARALAEAGLTDNWRGEVLSIASAAHANAQGLRGARGSGADIAAAVFGGTIGYEAKEGTAVSRFTWPKSVTLVPFFTGAAADTAMLVSHVMSPRWGSELDAALDAIAHASRAACSAMTAPEELVAPSLIAAFSLAAAGIDRLAMATGADLVPACVSTARAALAKLGGTAKTTGAGGGDVAIAVIPATADVSEVGRILIESGCKPLRLSVDETGVDTRPVAQ